MHSSETHAVCRGCGMVLNGEPHYKGKQAVHPRTGKTVPFCFYGGFVCSRTCDERACLEQERSMPGHGTSQQHIGTAARERIERNWRSTDG